MQCIGVSFREFPLAKMVRMLPGRSFLSLCHSSTDLRSGHQHPVPMSPPLLTAGPFVVPLLNLQDPGATTKALEERISKLRRQAREELAAVDLLPSDVPVIPSGPSIQTGYPGPSILTRSPSPSNPSHASISATKSIPIGPPLQSHHSSRQLLPQDSQSSLINFPIRTYEISPRKTPHHAIYLNWLYLRDQHKLYIWKQEEGQGRHHTTARSREGQNVRRCGRR